MQSGPDVPVKRSFPDVPTMTCVPAGQQAGLSPRMTVIRWVAVTLLPAPSVAFQVTSVVPGGKRAGALLVMVTPPHASEAVAWPMLMAPQLVVVTSAGTDANLGTVVSCTVTLAGHADAAPDGSLQVSMTGTVPGPNGPLGLAVQLMASPSGSV